MPVGATGEPMACRVADACEHAELTAKPENGRARTASAAVLHRSVELGARTHRGGIRLDHRSAVDFTITTTVSMCGVCGNMSTGWIEAIA